MTSVELQPAVPPPIRRRFLFSLRTLPLLVVVFASSLAVFGSWGIVVFALVVGLAIYIHQAESLRSLAYLALIVLCLICLIGLLLPAVQSAIESPRRATCANNLKNIVLALQSYQQKNGRFPPAYIADANGKPMHSWRVLMLPELDCAPLYSEYDFREPWDGPTNKRASDTHVDVYACPSDPNACAPGATQTSFVAVVGPNAAWAGEKSRKLGDFAGAASNTIMLVEVVNSGIHWAEPKDLSLDSLGATGSSALALSSNHGRNDHFFFTDDYGPGVNVALADGSIRYLRTAGLSTDDLRSVLKIGGYQDESHGDLNVPQRRVNWFNIAALAVWLLSVGTLLIHAVRSKSSSL